MNLIDASGKLVRWPRKESNKKIAIEHLADFFTSDRIYSEKEVNNVLREAHSFQDWALLRRELFERGFLDRDARSGRYCRKGNHILNTPNFVSGTGVLSAALRLSASTSRDLAGSMMPSSHSRADE